MSQTNERFRRPGLILADLLQKHARGEKEPRHYHRAVVLAIDHDGGLLENPNGSNGATVGPENPRGAVRARILTDGMDRLRDDDQLRTFWPMFPPDQIGMPVSPGEHVYVTFEDGLEHGMWLTRVAGHDSANIYKGADSYVGTHVQQSAMDSFYPNKPDYQQTDEHASLAPTPGATSFFDEDS